MIDSGATGNFITRKYTKRQKHPIRDKQQPYRLIILDGILFRRNGEINQKTILLSVTFQKYYCEMIFDIVDIANYNIIFEIFWLKKYKL